MVDFDHTLGEVLAHLRLEQRVSYRALKRRFDLDDDTLEDIKSELIDAKRLAADEDGKVLVWTGGAEPDDSPAPRVPAAPASYTPRHLAARIEAERTAMEARSAETGERKTITALFADLKGSTALLERLDPEEARAIIDPALALMMDAVHHYEGFVAQALGDGILALFGAPIAHEDHPQRAVHAALRMRDAMRAHAEHRQRLGAAPLQLRIGINTGEVVVRAIRKDDLHTDYVPVGHTTNLAARLEQLATPDTILISASTARLVQDYFALHEIGDVRLKGIEDTTTVFEVLRSGTLRTRLEAAGLHGFSRYVGRQREIEVMHQALAAALAGHGQIVGVMGEPGIGKSRLFYEFHGAIPADVLLLEAHAIPHGAASPYLPVIALLQQYFGFDADDDPVTRRAKVDACVQRIDRGLNSILPYLHALFALDEPNSPLRQMDAALRRQRTFGALRTLLLGESALRPVVFVFEDLHWIDDETQGLLDALAEGISGARFLLLVNFRPDYRHPWSQKTYFTQVRLTPLDDADAHRLLDDLLGSAPALATLKQAIVARTDGTPFFIEEVVQTLVEEGLVTGERGDRRLVHMPEAMVVPTTVQGVLAARIDRLPAREKEFLQLSCSARTTLSVVAAGRRGRLARRRAAAHAGGAAGQGVRLRTSRRPRYRVPVQTRADAGGRLRLAARRAPPPAPRAHGSCA